MRNNLHGNCVFVCSLDVIDATPVADSRINDRLIKCIHSSIRHVLSSSAIYFVVCYFQHVIFNTSKLLNHVASSVKLMTHR